LYHISSCLTLFIDLKFNDLFILFSFILFFAADTSVDTAALARAVFCARVDDDVSAGAQAAAYLSGLAGSLSRELDWEKRNLAEARAIRASLETEAAEKAGVARCSDAPQAVAAVCCRCCCD
jgi:hypothetical protein